MLKFSPQTYFKLATARYRPVEHWRFQSLICRKCEVPFVYERTMDDNAHGRWSTQLTNSEVASRDRKSETFAGTGARMTARCFRWNQFHSEYFPFEPDRSYVRRKVCSNDMDYDEFFRDEGRYERWAIENITLVMSIACNECVKCFCLLVLI